MTAQSRPPLVWTVGVWIVRGYKFERPHGRVSCCASAYRCQTPSVHLTRKMVIRKLGRQRLDSRRMHREVVKIQKLGNFRVRPLATLVAGGGGASTQLRPAALAGSGGGEWGFNDRVFIRLEKLDGLARDGGAAQDVGGAVGLRRA